MRYLVKVDDLDIERILRVDVDVKLTKTQITVREALLKNKCSYSATGKELNRSRGNIHDTVSRMLKRYKVAFQQQRPELFHLWSRKVRLYDLHKIGKFYVDNMYTQQEIADYFGLDKVELFSRVIELGYKHPINGGKRNIITHDYVKKYFESQGYKLLAKEYVDANTKMDFVCPNGHKHSISWHHFYTLGARCGKCPQRGGNYTTTVAERHKEEFLATPAVVYKVRLYDEKEDFYKIGISIDFDNRKYSFPYSVEVVELEETNLYDASYREDELHDLHKKYRYQPKKHFGGHNECFSKLI